MAYKHKPRPSNYLYGLFEQPIIATDPDPDPNLNQRGRYADIYQPKDLPIGRMEPTEDNAKELEEEERERKLTTKLEQLHAKVLKDFTLALAHQLEAAKKEHAIQMHAAKQNLGAKEFAIHQDRCQQNNKAQKTNQPRLDQAFPNNRISYG